MTELSGLIDPSAMGHTIPVGAELYPPSPIIYTDVEAIAIPYRTSVEAARAFLPSVLEIEEPATAIMSMLKINQSTIGGFHEAQITLRVLYKGEPRRYNVLMMTTSDSSLAFGREVLGAPKKLGYITLDRAQEGLVGIAQRPKGLPLINAAVAPRSRIEPDPGALNMTPSLSLRIIRHPDGGVGGERCVELVETAADWIIKEQWEGPAALSFPGASNIDPFHAMPVLEVLTGMYTRLEVHSPHPKVVETLA